MTRLLMAVAIGLVAVGLIALATAGPSPTPLPAGATTLVVRTQPPVWRLPWELGGCGLAALNPVRMEVKDDRLVFVSAQSADEVPVVFPAGFPGWTLEGVGSLVAPGRTVVAREGDVLTGIGGGTADNGDFLVCFSTPNEYEDVVQGGP